MRRSRRIAFVVVQLIAVVFAAASFARAQGVIVPGWRCPPGADCIEARPRQLPRSLPVRSIKIDARIAGQVATTHVEQVFRNDTDFTLEGTYFFPVPETARAGSSARCARARRRGEFMTRSCGGSAIRACSNTLARTCSRRASSRSRRTRTRSWS